jgi:hypothetical protein
VGDQPKLCLLHSARCSSSIAGGRPLNGPADDHFGRAGSDFDQQGAGARHLQISEPAVDCVVRIIADDVLAPDHAD